MRVGKVTEEECKEIKNLNGIKHSLEELLLILPKDDALYENVTRDMNLAIQKYDEWWGRIASKYKWKKRKDARWSLNFETREIDLIIQN